jgi:hypothetical protein
MNKNKKTAVFVGILFLTAMIASLVGGGLVESVISIPDTFSAILENQTLLIVGVLLELVNAIAVLGIGVLMFTVLKQQNETLATGYLSLRIVEAVFCSLIVISPLSLIRLSQGYSSAGMISAEIQLAGEVSIAGRASTTNLLIPIFFCLGAFLLYSLLYRSKLLPRFISVWGGIAAVLILTMNMSSLLGLKFGIGASLAFALPIILNEIFMGIWLIVKGFNSPASLPNPG